MLEVTYLRLRGLFPESADAAQRLRAYVDQIQPGLISVDLQGFAERSSAVSLQLQEHVVEARWAYESSLQLVRSSPTSCLTGETAGKLALLEALDGNNELANSRIAQAQSLTPPSAWGQATSQRSVLLAQAYIALSNLDLPTLRMVLDKLPAAPDTDEFWAVHAFVLAIFQALDGTPQTARQLISGLFDTRRYSLSAMTRRMLAGASLIIDIYDPEAADATDAHAAGHAVLKAFKLILRNRHDAAITLLDSQQSRKEVLRWENLRFYLRLAASNPEGPSEEVAQLINKHHHQSGVLLDLALLSMVAGWSNIAKLMELSPEEHARLDSLRHLIPEQLQLRPQLTPREKELLQMLRAGLSRKEIAVRSFRTENTIKSHQRSLYRKLEAKDARSAVENARRWRI